MKWLFISFVLLTLAGCSKAPPPPQGSIPQNWKSGDPEISYSLLPVVNGIPLDASQSIYLTRDEKIVVQVIAVESMISEDRQRRWGLTHRDMREAYNEELSDRQTHVLGQEQEDNLLVLADGKRVDYQKVRIKPGVLAGEDVVWGTGLARQGTALLIVNSGCRTEDYNRARIEELFKSVEWNP